MDSNNSPSTKGLGFFIGFSIALVGGVVLLVTFALGISGHTYGIHPLCAGFIGPIIISLGVVIMGQ